MEPSDLMEKQCTATAKTTGNRCRQPAIRGGTVCRFHGGAAPQVKAKAALVMLGLRDKGLAEMDLQLTAHDVSPSTVLALVVGLTKTVAEMEDRESGGPGMAAVDEWLGMVRGEPK